MKIAIIANPQITVPPEKYGGIERIVFILIQELIKLGHEVTLYGHPDSKPNCTLRAYTGRDYFNIYDFVRINVLTASILFERFDVVHSFGRMSNIALLMPTKLPKIISYQLPPTLSQLHKALQIARKNTLHFIGCSDYITSQLNSVLKSTTIHNAVNINHYNFQEDVQPDAPLVFLGRIQADKGTHIAIEVAKKTNRKLIIAGNIPTEQIHEQYFRNFVEPHLDKEKIEYVGAINDAEKNLLLGRAICLLMPVTWDEPFGIVMVESLACGTPVIGFNRGAVKEIVKDGINGFVCDNSDEMASAVKKLSKIDRNDCRKMVCSKFSSEHLARAFEKTYYDAIVKAK